MRFTSFLTIALAACLSIACGCSSSVDDPAEHGKNKQEQKKPDSRISAPPASLTQWLDGKESPLNSFYKKYIDCDGLPIVSSGKVRDTSLVQACYIARTMLSKHPEARDEMIKCHFRIGVVAYNEKITDLPECKMMSIWWPDTDWDERGRGYGATEALPVMSIGEENLVPVPNFQERYWNESIMVHEFAHNVDFAMRRIDPKFKTALLAAFKNAQEKGLYKENGRNTYWLENDAEYFAEGAQAWFNTCRIGLTDRTSLRNYDPQLYDLMVYTFTDEYLHGYHFDK